MKKRRQRKIKGFINYIFALVFAIIFALFLNADVGWFIAVALVFSPVISIIFSVVAAKSVKISAFMQEELLAKGDAAVMNIQLSNPSLFPTPPIDIEVTKGVGMPGEVKGMTVCLMPESSRQLQLRFRAAVCGKHKVGVEAVKVTDYFGIFTFKLASETQKFIKTVMVIPDIADVSATEDILVKVRQVSEYVEECDDTLESSTRHANGMPGYENRDYVEGEPLRRINWKQSAKLNKLLVRLDEEQASQSINVILDSGIDKKGIGLDTGLQSYYFSFVENEKTAGEDITDSLVCYLAGDTIEHTLGIMYTLLRYQYNVNFYICFDNQYEQYILTDEMDLEHMRLRMASYEFHENGTVERFPCGENGGISGLFVSPNDYAKACAVDSKEAVVRVYSIVEEIKKQGTDKADIIANSTRNNKKAGIKDRVTGWVKELSLPYVLALLLSVGVFSVFGVPVVSVWTVVQAVTGIGVICICCYVNKHRIMGVMLIMVFILADLFLTLRLAFGYGGLGYMHWFVSGGSEVANTPYYLATLITLFTVFFFMVVFYFSKVLYRMSFLMLVSLIPFIICVKVMHDINMTQVVLVTTMNILAFIVYLRTEKNTGKKIYDYKGMLLSFGVYIVIFILSGLAVPETETKYYYLFESVFLKGNTSEKLPDEYSQLSEYSGNAEGFNQLNNRKLYEITNKDSGKTFYMKRQNFDLYDFENDRWYAMEEFQQPKCSLEEWEYKQEGKNIYNLISAMNCASDYNNSFGNGNIYEDMLEDYSYFADIMTVKATNFPSVSYILPSDTVSIDILGSDENDKEYSVVSDSGVVQKSDGYLYKDMIYGVNYHDFKPLREKWIMAGGANCSLEESIQMLEELKETLTQNLEPEYLHGIEEILNEANTAKLYKTKCQQNVLQLPESVRKLALDITRDCQYDWQKAEALQLYFSKNGFVYDLSYDAPDDSVEYFLFEGKTGTCSDYATAYILMARSVGLVARYVEGFVPKEEYNGDYVIRTDCGHAYPEVYIPNVGYVVYEATIPQYYKDRNVGNNVFMYFVSVMFAVIGVLAVVSAIILLILLISRILAPYLNEKYFIYKCNKVSEAEAVIMIYKRIQNKITNKIIERSSIYTPCEYGEKFEVVFAYDISTLVHLVEKYSYTNKAGDSADTKKAITFYYRIKEVVKQHEKRLKYYKNTPKKSEKIGNNCNFAKNIF